MAKLEKSSYPAGHGANDFECMGPPAIKDGEFDGVYMADMGCFNQEDVDSNKYYHAAVVKSKKNGSFYAYFEWGRVGASKPQFQFEEGPGQAQAQANFASQCHSKNDKRGMWTTIAGIRTLIAKPGKDVYKVQSLQSRTTGLPDAKNITSNAGLKTEKAKPAVARTAKKYEEVDAETRKLMSDMRVAVVKYTRSSLEGGNIPTQSAINEARTILQAAESRLIHVGDDLTSQVNDKDLKDLTYHIRSRVPKKKAPGIGPEEWILSKNNILLWRADLDAFESSIYANVQIEESDADPLGGMPLKMRHLRSDTEEGQFIHNWAPKATKNRHGGIGDMQVHNAWRVDRFGDDERLEAAQMSRRISGEVERPPNQPTRTDLSREELKRFVSSNTALLFHGTRSVNVPGILRESLRFPKELVGVVISGAMFGPGSYFACDWKKSAGYTSMQGSYWSGGGGDVQGRHAFMFLVDVVLGKPHVAPGPRGYTCPPDGYHSVLGAEGRSGVQNNEWIIYRKEQHRLRYLIEFSQKRGRW